MSCHLSATLDRLYLRTSDKTIEEGNEMNEKLHRLHCTGDRELSWILEHCISFSNDHTFFRVYFIPQQQQQHDSTSALFARVVGVHRSRLKVIDDDTVQQQHNNNKTRGKYPHEYCTITINLPIECRLLLPSPLDYKNCIRNVRKCTRLWTAINNYYLHSALCPVSIDLTFLPSSSSHVDDGDGCRENVGGVVNNAINSIICILKCLKKCRGQRDRQRVPWEINNRWYLDRTHRLALGYANQLTQSRSCTVRDPFRTK